MGSGLSAHSFCVYNMMTAVSLLLASMRIFNRNLLVPSFPFNSGKIMLVWAKLDKNKSCRGHVTIHVKILANWTVISKCHIFLYTINHHHRHHRHCHHWISPWPTDQNRENHSWAQCILHTWLIWFTQVHVENRFLSPNPGPVYLNHWKFEFLTKHYHDQGSLENTPVVCKLFQEIEIWGPFFLLKKNQMHCSIESGTVVLIAPS